MTLFQFLQKYNVDEREDCGTLDHVWFVRPISKGTLSHREMLRNGFNGRRYIGMAKVVMIQMAENLKSMAQQMLDDAENIK
jgi:hypothetical protein